MDCRNWRLLTSRPFDLLVLLLFYEIKPKKRALCAVDPVFCVVAPNVVVEVGRATRSGNCRIRYRGAAHLKPETGNIIPKMSRKQQEEAEKREESEAKIKHNKNPLDTILFSGSGSQHKKLQQLPKVKIHKNARD